MKLMHEEITGRIRQTAYEIHCYLGCGFLEKVYRNALTHRLRKQGMRVEPEKAILVRDEDGTVLGEYFADHMVDDLVVIEVKAVASLCGEHVAQVLNYLKATGKEVGLLINFGSPRFQFRRVVRSEDRAHSAFRASLP